MKMHRAEQAMEDVLDKCSMYKRPKLSNNLVEESWKEGQRRIAIGDIVSYAHKISYSTFAPPSFITNQELPPGFQPPAPQAEHMRASALYQFSDEELGFRPVPSATPLELKAPEPSASAPEALPKPPPGWKPGMPVELPPMPPGWKPGMELPPPPLALANLPPMPPGWKPGDPVPLPVVQPQIPPPERLRPQAQPIQVAHVDLDLNPDLEGGFYSSESEDEDDDSESEEE
ncbi:Hydroxyproline-rich glycoprotein family protein [Klebsormidium nitens]|uniref:Hydroxyproline-rich glycoprotein family protein n=1 Tax=Klebsormidium nitens TaxID=105231 RepID=A0A1Y1I5S2_KLENI|nr:Hydroxyproline-rich glycoprotein family protein [Klebsormidium nitens]|eukprot:GAQ84066.1 Hydroxyproline-rich glycoprotein family protein [Klebsormidium nitens]